MSSKSRYFYAALVLAGAMVAQAQTFTVIATLEQGFGTVLNGPPVRDAAGNLYNASGYGGDMTCNQGAGCGFVYRVDPTGKVTVLYNFQGKPDGAIPLAGLVLDNAGNLYGATEYGGTYNLGSVFKLDSSGKETVLHSFSGPPKDGEQPFAGLSRDSSGNLYGTTLAGGRGTCFGSGCGIVFKVNPATGKETVLYKFSGGADGATPWSTPLVVNGVVYGTTVDGGNVNCQPSGNSAVGCGVVYKLAKGVETVLYKFNDMADGGFPVAGVIRDVAGNLYGTTEDGGDLNCNSGLGCGVAYKLDPSGTETVLHTFEGQQDGQLLHAGLVFDGPYLYGSTEIGGGIFRVDTSGNFALMHALNSTSTTTMVRDNEGNLYGITGDEVFEFTP